MPELIDKKRAEAKVFLIARFFIDRPDRDVELVKAVIHRCCEEIDKQPTIESEPVRHGRWIVHTTWNGMFGLIHSECSECKFDRNGDLSSWKFCPNCGARMDASLPEPPKEDET